MADALSSIGAKAAQRGDYDEAERDFRRALSIRFDAAGKDALNARPLTGLGESYSALARLELARGRLYRLGRMSCERAGRRSGASVRRTPRMFALAEFRAACSSPLPESGKRRPRERPLPSSALALQRPPTLRRRPGRSMRRFPSPWRQSWRPPRPAMPSAAGLRSRRFRNAEEFSQRASS